MTDRNDEELPPLGERTPGRPARPRSTTPWYRRAPVVALAGLGVGLLLGFGLASIIDDGGERAAVEGDAPVETTLRRTTTTSPSLPPECAEAIRSAEQSLTLLDQAFQTARRFDVENLDRMLAELDQLRRSLSERIRACVERA
jgi:hypothetical protein